MKIDYSTLPKIDCPVCGSEQNLLITKRFDNGPIVKCCSCNHIYLNVSFTDDVLKQMYDNYHGINQIKDLAIIEGWFADSDGVYQIALRKIIELGGIKNKNLLEIGCGVGRFLYECKLQGANVTGIDISPGSVALAKKYFNLDIVQVDLSEALSCGIVKKESFDLVCIFELIEHVKFPLAFLQDICYVLKPGGNLIISTPNFEYFYFLGKSADVVTRWQEHLQFFTPETLEDIIIKAGFKSLLVTTVNNLEFGDRMKQKFSRNLFVNKLWVFVRNIKVVYKLKDIFFSQLNACKTREDIKLFNGTCIFSVSKKA